MSKKNNIIDPHATREANKYENPIPSREFILDQLEQSTGPVNFKSLAQSLALESDEHLEALRRRVAAMERDGQIITNRRGDLGATQKMDLVRGRVQGHRDGFGFVITADGSPDLYLANRQMQKVFDGDEVLVRPGPEDMRGRREASIVEVLTRNTEQLVGRLLVQGGTYFVRPDNPRHTQDIMIPADEVQGAVDGQFVVVEITQHPDRYRKALGRIKEVLGDHMAPGMEIDVAIRSYGIPHTWPSEVERQTAVFTGEVNEEDKLNRVDLRHLPLITIDGEDARDFDDAVYCEAEKGGGWRLYVAIADVSHYVPPGTALDQEALVRGTSVYFPDFVVPMLPHILSNGLCSLNPHVDRLCMVCEMSVSAAGKITGYTFFEGVMHSHARLTYTQVGLMLAEKDSAGSGLRKEFSAVMPVVDQLHKLYAALRGARELRGAIDFESNETRIIFDSTRKIEKIIPVQRNDAHKLIEECMLAANVCAAQFLEGLEVPALYRVHESPNEQKLALLHEFLGGLGLAMRGGDDVTPQAYKEVLSKVEGRPDAHLIQTVMLRSMNQARYQPENHGHFGLAYPAYAHFTSPIRRYPDLVVHRAIRAVIRSNRQTSHVQRLPSTPKQEFTRNYPYGIADMLNFGEQCSAAERRADEATRDVVSWLKCEYLQERVGEEFEGVVSSVTGFGLFIELNELYVEGLLHITSLPQDYYHHEVAQHRLVGERTGRGFRLGDTVTVRVARVDLDERKIDFEFAGAKSNSRNEIPNARADNTSPSGKSARKPRKRPASKAKAAVPAGGKQTTRAKSPAKAKSPAADKQTTDAKPKTSSRSRPRKRTKKAAAPTPAPASSGTEPPTTAKAKTKSWLKKISHSAFTLFKR